jgi:NADP-dependent aldehyde dehydrogenase
MIHQPILVNGAWREASFPVSSFKAVSPGTGKQLQDSFSVSSFLDLDEMLQAEETGRTAIEKIEWQARAALLESIAEAIAASKSELCQTAEQETGLSRDFLASVELPAMLTNLRQASHFCLNRSWREAVIDSKTGFRTIRMPLPGPIVIFSPASLPLSMNVCGGNDFACAIAAGNSIIAKGNPITPNTCMFLARIIHGCIEKSGLPGSLFQFFFSTTNDLGYRLAAHPMIGAMVFSGSKRSGLALKENSDRAGNPGFYSMPGANPVFFLPDITGENKKNLSQDICSSVLPNDGQSCNKPGLFFLVEDKNSSNLIKTVTDEFNIHQARPMLTDLHARSLDATVSGLIRIGARKLTRKDFYQPNPFVYPNTVLHVEAKTYLKSAIPFQEEAFGPVIIFVTLEDESQFAAISKTLEGCRNCSIYAGTGTRDQNLFGHISRYMQRKAGRIIVNRLPDAVSSCQAIIGGGVFPASSHPGFTDCGMPGAIKRLTMLQCYENANQQQLPEDLCNTIADSNLCRMVDGNLCKGSI